MEEDANSEFLKQFGGSATANLVTCMLLFAYKFIEGRCRHSKCSSNTRLCKCSADNYNTDRRSSPPSIKENVGSKESLQKLQAGDDKEIPTRHSAVGEIGDSQRQHNPPNSEVVTGENAIWKIQKFDT